METCRVWSGCILIVRVHTYRKGENERFAVRIAVKYRFFLVLEGEKRGYRLVEGTSLVSGGKISHFHHC